MDASANTHMLCMCVHVCIIMHMRVLQTRRLACCMSFKIPSFLSKAFVLPPPVPVCIRPALDEGACAEEEEDDDDGTDDEEEEA